VKARYLFGDARFERLLVVQAAGRHDLLTAPKFIAIVDPSHRG
jgi:hypothetical protein